LSKNVTVIDQYGNACEPTYPKRARGLIKKGRARAIGDDAICLIEPVINADDCVLPSNESKEHMNNADFLMQELAYLKVKVEHAEKGPEKDNALTAYSNALTAYIELQKSSVVIKNAGNNANNGYDSAADPNSYDFSDMPGMPNFVKQMINNGYIEALAGIPLGSFDRWKVDEKEPLDDVDENKGCNE